MPELTTVSRHSPPLVPPPEQHPSLRGWITMTFRDLLRLILSPKLHAHYAQHRVIDSVAAIFNGRVCPSVTFVHCAQTAGRTGLPLCVGFGVDQ